MILDGADHPISMMDRTHGRFTQVVKDVDSHDYETIDSCSCKVSSQSKITNFLDEQW